MEHWAENLTHAGISLHSSRLRQIKNLYEIQPASNRLKSVSPLKNRILQFCTGTVRNNHKELYAEMICISTQIQAPKDKRNAVDYTIYCYVLPRPWRSPVHFIHLFQVRRIPDPGLHIAYLIVLWFSHALFRRKPVRSICPQLHKLLGVTSTICSQARTTALQDEALLSFPRQGYENLSHTCIYHHSTQN